MVTAVELFNDLEIKGRWYKELEQGHIADEE